MSSGPGTEPDILLIEYLCNTVFADYSINRDLLINWQVELIDLDSESLLEIIDQEIIISEPLKSFSPSHSSTTSTSTSTTPPFVSHITHIISQLSQLEDEIYINFKIIITELLLYLFSLSYALRLQLNRLRIHDLFVDFLIQLLLKNVFSLTYMLNHLSKVLVCLFEFGCDVKLIRKLIFPLFDPNLLPFEPSRLCLLTIINQLYEYYPNQFDFFIFQGFQQSSAIVALPLEVTGATPLKLLTVATWFKRAGTNGGYGTNVTANGGPAPSSSTHTSTYSLSTLFVLSSSNSTPDSSSFKVQILNGKQFRIELLNHQNNSRMHFSFNQQIQYKPKNQGFTHLAFTYDSYKNLNLFIDGEYSESIPCPEIHRVIHTWNKVYIGAQTSELSSEIHESDDCFSHGADELLLRQLSILNVDVTNVWVSLLYNLGLGYSWDYKDFSDDGLHHLLNHLTFRGLINFLLTARSLTGISKDIKSIKDTSNTGGNDKISKIDGAKSQTNSHRTDSHIPSQDPSTSVFDRNTLVSLLSQDMAKQANVIFDTVGNNALGLSNSKAQSCSTRLLYHNSSGIYTSLFSIGGTSLFLRLMESYSKKGDHEGIYQCIKLVFCLINNNWRFAREFEDSDGYGIMMILLRQYKLNTTKVDSGILDLILSSLGICEENRYESILINPIGYKSLLLNDFYIKLGSDIAQIWFNHFELILNKRYKYSSINSYELQRIRAIVRFIQIMKSKDTSDNNELHTPDSRPSTPTRGNSNTNAIQDDNYSDIVAAASPALQMLLENDTSIENIRSLSLYTIFSIYSQRTPNLVSLEALTMSVSRTSSIKTLKKFSKSISIHWVLLLLDYHSDLKYSKKITIYGINLLVELLSVLGPSTINRFFQVNHGIDILTHFLRDWWRDDDIVRLIYNSAFDENANEDKKRLTLPEFLIILNNLALSGVYTLTSMNSRISSPLASPRSRFGLASPIKFNNSQSQDQMSFENSADVIHFLNVYSELIRKGLESKNSNVHMFYNTKEWLDGIFELIGQINIISKSTEFDSEFAPQFISTYDNLVGIVSGAFIGELLNLLKFFKIFKSLNAFTKKLVLDTVFPRIFDHMNQFITISDDVSFYDTVIELSNFYISEFLDQGYKVSNKDYQTFLNCCLSIIERKRGNGGRKFIGSLGSLVVINIVNQNIDDDTEKFEKLTADLLYKIVAILQVLKRSDLMDLISIMLAHFIKLTSPPHYDNLFNLLRTCYLSNQDQLTKDSNDESDIIIQFLEYLVTKNDDDALKYLQRHSTLRSVATRNLQEIRSRNAIIELGKLNVLDMATVIGDGMSWKNNMFVESCQKDCDRLKLSIIEGESLKYNRFVQDQQEIVQHCVGSYNSKKIESSRLINIENYENGAEYVLDYIEGTDRMRKRMVIEDQLSDSEKLSYHISVPVKSNDLKGGNKPTLKSRVSSVLAPPKSAVFSMVGAVNFVATSTAAAISGKAPGNEPSNDELDWEVVDEDNNLLSTVHLDDFELVDELPTDKNRKVIRSLFMGDHISCLWNISQINGLAPIESLMILGQTHVYLIENYFHNPDGGGVIDVNDAPVSLRDPYLQLVNSQPNKIENDNSVLQHRSKTWSLDKLCFISKRHFLLRDVALEMFFRDGASILITCPSTKERNTIYKTLHGIANVNEKLVSNLQLQLLVSSISKLFAGSGSHSIHNSSSSGAVDGYEFFSPFSDSLAEATNKWKQGEMSNFYYLMIINTLAGRTFNDLTQYPVFPWVIADYTSETLNLGDPKTFRDLSKPMGAQTPERARQFSERFEALSSFNDDDTNPPFHYGTHYSSAMIVTSYLIRLKPYVQSYLLLQGGKFDHADRLFNSIERAWLSASRDNTTDVRELTPEFFYLPEFLTNGNQFEFGKLQSGDSVNDVILPPWCKNDPKMFIEMNRKALELPHVSANLHLWIDLVFGFKQSGPAAVKSLNVFHHLSYNGAINLDNIHDEMEKRAVIGMINNFGQTPRKIFQKQHVQREIYNFPDYYLSTIPLNGGIGKLIFELKLRNQAIKKLELINNRWIGRPDNISYEDDIVVRKATWGKGSIFINNTSFLNIHLSDITKLIQIGQKMILAGLEDGLINAWRYIKKTNNLEVVGTLRGHVSPIIELKYSKNFKMAVSLDKDGVVLVWDLARLKFVRRICLSSALSISISNNSGIIGVVKNFSEIETYTINGDIIARVNSEDETITTISFGNNTNHTYWSTELIGLGRRNGKLEVYSFGSDTKSGEWELKRLFFSHSNVCLGVPSVIEVQQTIDLDLDEKLVRGGVTLIVGDSTGRVYKW